MNKMKRFVFQFTDGRYYRESGSRYIDSLNHHRVSAELDKRWGTEGRALSIAEDFMTTDINEAKVFKSKQSIRSSNAYSWGGTIHEVTVTISIKE
jgi:hypothetical protein